MQQLAQKRGKLGVRDAATQELGPPAQAAEGSGDLAAELLEVVGTTVGQGAFGQVPHSFIGVELRRVAGEIHDLQARAVLAQRFDGIAMVNGGVVEEQHQRATQVPQQNPDEFAHAHLVQILAVEAKVQPQALAAWAHRDRRDDRHFVAARAMTMQRRLTPWRPGLEDGGDQEEARFVGEDKMGTQPCSIFFTLGQCSRFQRSIALALRSSARRSGF